ncbi:M [Niakha virus]|uniref:M n=1 Tax=Niakha virus TaxID=1348439 RepID=R9ZRL9_9RHAB|nr:M [Niakha virus] [Niakha virus]AGO44082.1 M [Niakha virus] [Niakha virus]
MNFLFKKKKSSESLWGNSSKALVSAPIMKNYKVECKIELNVHNKVNGPDDIVDIYRDYCSNYCGVIQSRPLHCFIMALGICHIQRKQGMSQGGDYLCEYKGKIQLQLGEGADPGVCRSYQIHRKRISHPAMLAYILGNTVFEEISDEGVGSVETMTKEGRIEFKKLVAASPFILRSGKSRTQICARP